MFLKSQKFAKNSKSQKFEEDVLQVTEWANQRADRNRIELRWSFLLDEELYWATYRLFRVD